MMFSNRNSIFVTIFILWGCIANTYEYFTCSTDPDNCSCVTISSDPVDKIVLSGTDSILTCQVADATEDDDVLWLRGGSVLGSGPNISCCARYTVGNGNIGNYNLYISNTNLSDQNTFQCQIPNCLINSNTARLTVYVLPIGPIIRNDVDSRVDVFTGMDNTLTCTANGAKPETTLRWYNLGTGEKLFTQDTTSEPYDELFDTTSSYTFVPNKTDDGVVYRCSAFSAAITLTGQSSIDRNIALNTIDVPTYFSTGFSDSSTVVIDANEARTVTCIAENTDFTASMEWYKDNVTQNITIQVSNGNADGTYNISKSIYIKADETSDGVTYSCTIKVNGYSTNYNDAQSFTVSVYYFPYAAVIGGSIGGAILLILLIILLIFCVRRSNKKKRKEQELRAQNIQSAEYTNKEATREEDVVEENITPLEVEVKVVAGADQGYDSGTETTKSEYQATSESDSDTDESVYPPSGETFSRTSSMVRSDRGSPIIMYSDLDPRNSFSEDDDPASLPSPISRMPMYYTRDRQTHMLTDV